MRKRSGQIPNALATILIVLVAPLLIVLRMGHGEFFPNAYLFLVIVAALVSVVVWLLIWLRRAVRRRRAARRARIG
jgi:hypothetical protein